MFQTLKHNWVLSEIECTHTHREDVEMYSFQSFSLSVCATVSISSCFIFFSSHKKPGQHLKYKKKYQSANKNMPLWQAKTENSRLMWQLSVGRVWQTLFKWHKPRCSAHTLYPSLTQNTRVMWLNRLVSKRCECEGCRGAMGTKS